MEIKNAASGFAALAQTTRLEVLRALVVAGPKGLPAGELAQNVGVPSSTLSFHLKELVSATLVTSERDGRLIIYRANYAGIHGLIEFLLRDCCSSDKEICNSDDMKEAARQVLETS